MSLVTEELLASLIGAVLVVRSGDYNSLILKAIFELVEHGVPLTSATAHVYNIIGLIRAIV